MEATMTGANRTGAATAAEGTRAMVEIAMELTPQLEIDTALSKAERTEYIEAANSVGSIPPPATFKGTFKSGIATLTGKEPSLLMDKIGERLAFERSGVRLYEALITKFEASASQGPTPLPPALEALTQSGYEDPPLELEGEFAAETLRRIQAEELQHFRLLAQSLTDMGGDPTAQTPCANVISTASLGFVQVLSDPRTTLAQCLNTMLSVELTDNAGWELLVQLADREGESELAGGFLSALGQEQEHLAIVRAWLEYLMTNGAGTPAV